MTWTIESGNAVKTLDEWGVSNLQRQLNSQARDQVTFEHILRDFTTDPIFPIDTYITIKRDGAGWFVGRVIDIAHTARPGGESHAYTLAGPWHFLEELLLQGQTAVQGGTSWTTHVLIGITADGSALQTTEQALTTVLEFAIARGAPFQIGTLDLRVFGDLSLYQAVDEVRDFTCAEVIQRLLRFHPDAVAWFDYTTEQAGTPTPTLHIQSAHRLTAVNVDLTPTVRPKWSGLTVRPRVDLQRPSVVLRYERLNTVDGQTGIQLVTDVYPPGATGLEPGALCATIDLRGFTSHRVTAEIETEALDLQNINWWKARIPGLNHAQVRNVQFTEVIPEFPDIVSITRTGTQNLPNRLISGQVADWMDVETEEETITALIDCDIYDPEGNYIETIVGRPYAIKITATDGTSGTYQTGSFAAGDPQPVGVAQYLYTVLNQLQYQGELSLEEEECTGRVLVGHKLNLLGLRTEWAAMAGLVQTVQEHVDSGSTQITFGPSQLLGPADLVDLLI